MVLRHAISAVILVGSLPSTLLWGWGYEAHKLVNGYAVDGTSGPLGDYFRANRGQIVALSIDADERKDKDRSEGHRHYVDLEYYGEPSGKSIPFDRGKAEARYGAENMVEWGTLPWVLVEVTLALRDAMAEGAWERVVPLAADLGHYLADLHQPLHTTVNYDGQTTGNRGVHHMFESNMVNRYLDQFGRPTGPLPAIDDLPGNIFSWVIESFNEVGAIISADIWARAELTPEAEAAVSQGFRAKPGAIPAAYYERLYVQTGLMAWGRLSKATVRLSALWLWAWSEAGRPLPPG